MKIILDKGAFLEHLFPELRDEAQLIEYLKAYYSVGSNQPDIAVEQDLIIISIDTEQIEREENLKAKLIKSVEKGDYKKGLKLALELVDLNPHISDHHRMLGQIYYEQQKSEEAMNALIEALRWDPKNGYALILMGNLHSTYKKDAETALLFYKRALEEKPDEFLALSNIAANLMRLKKYAEAKPFLNQALKINPKFSKAHLIGAMIASEEGKFEKAFEYGINCLKSGGGHYKKNHKEIETVISISNRIITSENGLGKIEVFKETLEEKTGKEIRIQEVENLPTAARIEYAETYGRDYHLLKYKSDQPAFEHLILHELIHLELAEEARKVSENQLFISGSKQERRFKHYLGKFIKKLDKRGVPQESIKNYIESLLHGMNSQVFNTPIDLFIEDRIYNYYPTLRPFQFISLFGLIKEGAEAVTREDIVKSSPKEIISKSKIYNLINAIHFKTLYHTDLIDMHKASKTQLQKAQEMYQGFLAIRDNKEPAKEYDLIYSWAKSLQLQRYFKLVDEDEFRKQEIASNETGQKSEKGGSNIEEKVRTFVENHEGDINMAVVMYMIDAFSFFEGMSKEEIKKVAFDLAHLGQSGIDPKKDGYHVSSIPGSNFTGYKTLAYYYVSWALGVPEMLSQLGMPFDEEYAIAAKMKE